jgi:N-glycosylase/DNA lyase
MDSYQKKRISFAARIIPQGPDLLLQIRPSELNLAQTLDCGQCFRFRQDEHGIWEGVALGRFLRLAQTETGIRFFDTSPADFLSVWSNYFDFSTDYTRIKRDLRADPSLRRAIRFAGGIRILRQDPFEVLISFLISQNNNIPRIKRSIERLCALFGEEFAPGRHAFPTPQAIAALSKEDLAPVSLGYRDEYLLDASRRIAAGEFSLPDVAQAQTSSARELLLSCRGIGPKVAECILLFGFHRLEAFPIDTWMKKVLAREYPSGFPQEFAAVAGVAQQYLFHEIRRGETGFSIT